ncbi:mechanosensitive ion channel domain-containing protein [Bdellovibrionota bacterium FG-1]
MWHKLSQPWIPLSKIEELVQFEPALLIAGLVLGAWLVYKLLLRDISPERHRNLHNHFQNLWLHSAIALTLFSSYSLLARLDDGNPAIERVLSYIGLFTLLSGSTAFVKAARILMFEYLFLSHMRVAVPLLLVNLFTLLLSMLIGGWLATEVFSVRLAPLLATSAIFSLVLGLALQDTLGNLFAGVALQFDKPYSIGDWIEIQNGAQKWVGRVEEISWRATGMIGVAEEFITVPNRVMAQAQISNFSLKTKPFIRSQVFRMGHKANIKKTKEILIAGAARSSHVRKDISPLVLITEVADSWLSFKLLYFIDDYGAQFSIGDEVITYAMEELRLAGIELETPKLQLKSPT